MSDTHRIEDQLSEALALTSNVLSETQKDDILMYINAGEWGLALETLCDFLYEDELPLPARAYALLQDAGTLMHLESSTWENLKPQIVVQ